MPRRDPHNRTRYWRDPALPGFSLLAADFTTHDYAPHSHDAFVVAVTEAGGAEFRSRGQTQEAQAERLLVFNPAEPHSGRMGRSQRWRYRSLYAGTRAIAGLRAALGIEATPYFLSNVIEDPALIATFLDLHRALDGETDDLRRHELVVAGFGDLFRRHGTGGGRIAAGPRDRALLDRAIALIGDRHAEGLTLEDLGQAVGLTPFQLIGLFNRGTGMTPHAYLTQVRLRAAIGLLRAGMGLAESAVAAGFYDQSALQNHFKRAYGITPLQYLRAHHPAGSKRDPYRHTSLVSLTRP